MKVRQMIKINIDFIMVILLPVLMLYMLTGQETHERLGTAMAALFVIHNVLNRTWFKNLFRGKYTLARSFLNITNCLLFLDMVLLAGSGIFMSGISGYVFAPLQLDGDMELLKRFHRFGAYWGFILMSVHLGQHWHYMMGMGRKFVQAKTPSVKPIWFTRGLAVTGAVYGMIAFTRQNMIGYLFQKTAAIYFDDGKADISYLWDCAAMIMLFAVIGYYVQKVLTKRRAMNQCSLKMKETL